MMLSLLNDRINLNTKAVLTVEPLVPLSLVTRMPGKFYRSESAPSHEMLYGLLENALGWHFSADDRANIVKYLLKRHDIKPADVRVSGVGFQSVLQFHVQFGPVAFTQSEESLQRYNDLWSQHLRTGGTEFPGGSRNHDHLLIPLMNALARGEVKLTDSGGKTDIDSALNPQKGDTINVKAFRSLFPQYYVTPTLREYIVPRVAYKYLLQTSEPMARGLREMLENPVAPLYLGSNDGWVEAFIDVASPSPVEVQL